MNDETSIELIPITNSLELTNDFKQIYEEAFPSDERRDWDQITELLNDKDFVLQSIYLRSKLIGMISLWNLQKFCFIEHFAICNAERGNGYGSLLLLKLLDQIAIPVILEVEEPTTAIAQKRIEFYERLNFSVCNAAYYQPPYSAQKNKVKMLLMSYPEKIELHNFQATKEQIFASVYKLSE